MNSTKTAFQAWAACLSAALFFSYELMQLHMFNAISSFLMKDLSMSATSFGYLCSAYLLADVIFLLPAGIILDKFSVRKVILTALFICLLGTLGFSFAHFLPFAFFCHFLSGIGNAFCFLSCMMFVARWFPIQKQAFVIGIIVTIGMLGGVVAQSPFSYLATTYGWRGAMLINSGIGAIIFFTVFLFAKDNPSFDNTSSTAESAFKDLKEALFNKITLFCGLYTGLMNLPIMVIGAVYGSLFLSQVHHFSLTQASLIASMICMGTIVGSSFFGYLCDKLEKRRSLMVFGSVISCVMILLIMFLERPNFSVMFFLFFMLGFFSSTQVLGYPIISERAPKHLTGTSMGVAAVIIMGLAAIAQPLSGQLMDLTWNHQLSNGTPLYALSNYLMAFSIFPISFLIAFFIARSLPNNTKEKQEQVKM